MKKYIGFLVVFMMAMGLFSGLAHANPTFNVTANYGTLVKEKGVCELSGSVSFKPVVPGETWAVGTKITMELLNNATLCRGIGTNGAPVKVADPLKFGDYEFTVYGKAGASYLEITIDKVDLGGFGITIGGDKTRTDICLNLEETNYTESDPLLKLVEASYRDTSLNTYSGDIYIATVKKTGDHSAALCNKDELKSMYPKFFGKIGVLPEIPLDLEKNETQGQEAGLCGKDPGYTCIRVNDLVGPGVGFNDTMYAFNISLNPYKGLGIRKIILTDGTAGAKNLVQSTEYFDINGKKIFPDPNKGCIDYTIVKTVRVRGTLPPNDYYLLGIKLAWDETAVPGVVSVDFNMSKDPCGNNYSKPGISIAKMLPAGGVLGFNSVFPYGPAMTNGWFGAIVLNNSASVEVEVTLSMYEADGAMYEKKVKMPAHGSFTSPMDSLNPTLVGGVDNAFGDEAYWIKATSSVPISGYFSFGNDTTVQGYTGINGEEK